jgi:hypothetical protein
MIKWNLINGHVLTMPKHRHGPDSTFWRAVFFSPRCVFTYKDCNLLLLLLFLRRGETVSVRVSFFLDHYPSSRRHMDECERRRNHIDRERQKGTYRNLYQCHCIHKSHLDSPRHEPGRRIEMPELTVVIQLQYSTVHCLFKYVINIYIT